jgi:16S rRNA (uracil1498-N3)-methyltransferase
MYRFFIPPESIANPTPEIVGSDAKHIKRVMRLHPGDEIELFDGAGMIYKARITALTSEGVQVTILSSSPSMTESGLSLVVAQALLKDKKMDQLIRQLCELGISGWLPFLSARTIPTPGEQRQAARLERWDKIAREALKQCRRSRMPEIGPVLSFHEIVQLGVSFDMAVVFWENESVALDGYAGQEPRPVRILAVFGPEGGFADQEIDAARKSGFITAALGPRTLRSETATLAGCALLQYLFGDMGPKKS